MEKRRDMGLEWKREEGVKYTTDVAGPLASINQSLCPVFLPLWLCLKNPSSCLVACPSSRSWSRSQHHNDPGAGIVGEYRARSQEAGAEWGYTRVLGLGYPKTKSRVTLRAQPRDL